MKLNQHIIAVISIGEGVFYKVETGKELRKAITKWTVSQVLEDLDKRFGLDVPIFLLGFSTLGRGVSTRSSRRVTTHIQVCQGGGHSLDNLIQSYGRATGNVKSVLRKNLGANAQIKVLTVEADWKASQAYVQFCQAKVDGRDASQEFENLHCALSRRRVGTAKKGKSPANTAFTYAYVSDEEDAQVREVMPSARSDANVGEGPADTSIASTQNAECPKRKCLDHSCRVVTDDVEDKRQRTEM